MRSVTKKKQYVEQVLIVTDEGENTAPLLADAWTAYKEALNCAPAIITVQVGGTYDRFAQGLQDRGIELTRYKFNGGYYSLPNVLELLAQPSRADLVDLIMGYELPKRPTLVL